PERLAIHHRHHQVQQDHAGTIAGAQQVKRLLAIRRTDGAMTLLLEEVAQRGADRFIVVDHQDEGTHAGSLKGRWTVNVAPDPPVLATSMRPWCASTMGDAIQSPRPRPARAGGAARSNWPKMRS